MMGASSVNSLRADQRPLPAQLIIDTHQHLWDLSWQRLPWLENAPEILRRSYTMQHYQDAVAGLTIQAIYMEVDVAQDQLRREAQHIVELIRQPNSLTRAAVIGGRPAAEDFKQYVETFRETSVIKGVRQVLHVPETPAGYCLTREFIRGVRLLGQVDWSFDLCMRPGELEDAVRLVRECPDTRFVLDHCGNADPVAFQKKEAARQASHDPEAWKRSIERLAEFPNVVCKISGIVARAPAEWSPEDLAPIVNHCWDCFGPERVVFGSDWPVCLLAAQLRDWVSALHEIAKERLAAHQQKLWSENARRFYGLV